MTEQPITKRCNARERSAITRMAVPQTPGQPPVKCSEPALGTLDQRLSIICQRLGVRSMPYKPPKPSWDASTQPALGSVDTRLGIIIRRHGGSTTAPTATPDEKAEYLRWLRSTDPTAGNPYKAPKRAA